MDYERLNSLNRNVDYFEPIHAILLNDAYGRTRQFYFPNQGTAGASVYVVMEIRPNYTLEKLREELLHTLISSV